MTEAHQNAAKTNDSSHVWVKDVRALPTNPKMNDFLKVEYIDINLNNSRKLITNVMELTSTSKKFAEECEQVQESLLQLNQVKKQLDWLG